MGVVYRARQTALKRTVALKMILAGPHAGPELRARFRSETQSVARLQHPNIVQIYEVGDANGLPFCSLEYVEGGSLARKLADKPLPPLEAARLAEVLARAIHACHQRGVIHRDLKPANVLLAADSTPKITDFGLAKKLEGDLRQTRTGVVMGTPSYMAPEQAAGQAQRLGPHTDVYALGAILYEMLTGQPPFAGDILMDLLHRARFQEPVPPSRRQPRLPRDLETICLKCLEKEPQRRYAFALALAQDLERFLAGEPILGRRAGVVYKIRRQIRRNLLGSGLVLAFLLLLACAAAVGLQARKTQKMVQHDRRLKDRESQLEKALAATTWSREQIDTVEHLAGELEQLKPGRGNDARQHLVTRLGEVAASSFSPESKPSLSRADLAASEELFSLLRTYDPERAQSLHAQLQDRLASPTLILDLKAKQDHLDEVIPGAAGVIERHGRAWQRKQPVGSPLVATAAPFQGNMEVEARLPQWSPSARFGIVLGQEAPSQGQTRLSPAYVFVIGPPPSKEEDREQIAPSASPRADTAPALPGTLAIRIFRQGRLLRDLLIPAGAGPLVLRVSRQDRRLTFELQPEDGKGHLLEVEDLFPLGEQQEGNCSLYWPAGVRLTGLRIWRQTLPAAPSPLERGDDAFARQRFQEALVEYRTAAQHVRGRDLLQEVQCKEAMSLLELGQVEEAVTRFTAVLQEPGASWPLFAACQLWPLYIRQRRFAEADSVFVWLTAHYPPEQADRLIPESLRARIRAACIDLVRSFTGGVASGYHILQYDPERVRNCERALAIEKYLLEDPRLFPFVQALKVGSVFAYHTAGHTDRALQMAEELLPNPPGANGRLDYFVLEQYCWLMQLRAAQTGQRQDLERALAVLDANLHPPGGLRLVDSLSLYLERARLHVALGQPAEAEKDVGTYFRLTKGTLRVPQAFVLQGFLAEQRGDQAAAERAWRDGWEQCKRWQAADYRASLDGSILASLSGTFTDADAQQMVNDVMNAVSGFSPIARGIRNDLLPVPFVAAVVRQRWCSKRGREWARKAAFRSIPFWDHANIVVRLTLYEGFHQGAAPGPLPAEQDELLWKLAGDLLEAFSRKGTFTEAQAFQGALAWTGTMHFLGWAGLQPRLDPCLRGSLAYVLGRRYLVLGRKADAQSLFRTAVADAPPQSTLRRLAQGELDQLSKR
jgi:tetratricopeptide (TPR) repeat protein